MTFDGFAIDVGWLIEQDDADMLTIHSILSAVAAMCEDEANLLVDVEGHILGEYERYLGPHTIGRKILTHLMSAHRIGFHSGRLNAACEACLDSDGFDPSDRAYVGVAARVGGAYVTHEAKHLDPSRVALVRERCGVHVIGSEGFLPPAQ
ncbi:hypothetical protein [Demequina maris]|uniref:hypothetical protein n=1 Tax=Demequina maris TaxID=1638982 RepID=UPI0007806062|nr:hypothetical protein [Demequina maris]